MKGYLTSYARMFEGQPSGAPVVRSIEVPLIQRDYAQGRDEARVADIRLSFLGVLLDAIAGGQPVGLDFVYGKIQGGALHPLDGQQRLTTSFLLHWYLASAAGRLDQDASWTHFSYATRPSARLFCRRLVANPFPGGEHIPSEWIIDQPWYLHVWRHDPTIKAMLVMIDAIHTELQRLYPGLDPEAAWERLTDAETPAVSFYLLPLDDIDSDDELYIKMNSRGKPLTPFEAFKARFEQDIQHSTRAQEFAHKVDGAWSDLLWPFHGGDDIVDEEFFRYIDFIVELCELREGRVVTSEALGPRARAAFGADNVRSQEHLDLLFDAFDAWQDEEHVTTTFNGVFSTALPGQEDHNPHKVVLFGAASTNLFEQCCHRFDSQPGGNRAFTLQQGLLLYAVLLHLCKGTRNFPRRLRVLRNLIAASEDEVRRPNMPALVKDVEQVIIHGDLGAVTGFSSNQVEDERLKQELLDADPKLAEALFRLEDHPILRGTLSSFEFTPETFRQRAEAFEAAFADATTWSGLTGALLATGDYQRRRPNSPAWQFGTSSAYNEAVWRYLLTDAPRSSLATTRTVLSDFLDDLADADGDTAGHFDAVMAAWLAKREASQTFDWRYYLVKYPSMRSGATGIYYGVDGELGYSMCMLRTKTLNGNYRDPILLEVWRSSGADEHVKDPWFTGYDPGQRWLRLARSGAGMRSVVAGFALDPPEDEVLRSTFTEVCERHGATTVEADSTMLRIPQKKGDDGFVDSVDRVVVGAALLKDLVAAGL